MLISRPIYERRRFNLKNFFKKNGFISIETIIVSGLMIGLAGSGYSKFLGISIDVIDHSNGLVETVMTVEVNN